MTLPFQYFLGTVIVSKFLKDTRSNLCPSLSLNIEFALFQVKGHLDYMRQMDTILVAVGIPTKEGVETTPGHPHSVMLSEGKLDTPEAQTFKENGQHEENLIEASNKSEETNVKNELTETEREEQCAGRAQENGWDIPDISDLLDSLSVSESEQKDSSFFTCTESFARSDHQCTQEGQSDTDSEFISWEWDTNHWTTEHTITHHSKSTECPTQNQVAKGKQPCSATLPTHLLKSPVTEQTTTEHMDSDEIKG